MAQRVEGELYYQIDGQLAEIKRQLRQGCGYPYDLERLKNHLQNAIEGRFGEVEESTSSNFQFCGNFIVPAVSTFLARDHFVFSKVDKVNIGSIDSNFTEWFLSGGGKFEASIPRSVISGYRLKKDFSDDSIVTELERVARSETTLAQMWEMMKRQGYGQMGNLLINGGSNIFYICDLDNMPRTVYVRWSGEWEIHSHEYPCWWDVDERDCQVFLP